MVFEHDINIHNETSASVILPFLLKEFNPKSIVDVGCGLGQWLKVAQDYGIADVRGINSPFSKKEDFFIDKENILFVDLERPPRLENKFDMVLCFEVAEHLKEDSADSFVSFLTDLGDVVVFSAAIPHQGGDGHLNEQWPSYWIHKFENDGFIITDALREKIWNNNNVRWWYKQNTFVAIKRNLFERDYRHLSKKHFFAQIHPDLYIKKINQIEAFYQGKIRLVLALKIMIKSILRKINVLK